MSLSVWTWPRRSPVKLVGEFCSLEKPSCPQSKQLLGTGSRWLLPRREQARESTGGWKHCHESSSTHILKQAVLNWRKIKSGTSPKHLDYFSMSQELYSKQKLAYKYQGQAGALSISQHRSLLPASCYKEKNHLTNCLESFKSFIHSVCLCLSKTFNFEACNYLRCCQLKE